ncbi:MAG: peptidylprolyl isomerase, partial [Pseudomonadota bacterium]|nr:peptidylprolyl isomerase [Pseudomonadota bacterium]
LGPSHSIMIRVIEHMPERPRPLSQVAASVVAEIRKDRQRKSAAAAADALVRAAKASTLAKAADSAALVVVEMNAVERGSTMPSRPAVEAFFDTPRPRDNLVPVEKVEIGGQYFVYAIRDVRDGNPSQASAEQREELRGQLSGISGMGAQKAFVRATRAKYQIKVAEERL